MKFTGILFLLFIMVGCSSAPVKKEFRKILILGFTNPVDRTGHSIRTDEVVPLLNNVEKRINEQKTTTQGLRIVQKVYEESVWSNDDVREYGISKGFDDVFIVSLTLNISDARGNAFFKTVYLNVETGESEVVGENQKRDSSIMWGEVGNRRTRDSLVEFLTDQSKEGDFPELIEQPRLVRAPAKVTNKTAKIAIADPVLKNIEGERAEVIPGLIMNVVSESRKYQVVARNTEMDQILKEQGTSLSAAFNPETAVQIGKLSGASLLLTSEVNCFNNQCQMSFRLFDLATGSLLKTSSGDSDTQYTAIKNVMTEMMTTIDTVALSDSQANQ